jgi:DNA repair/transcription protein MET18/MMS19
MIAIKLTSRSRLDMKGLGDRYLRQHLGIAEGEKDPRNLLLMFSLDAVVLLEFDVQSFIEVG